MTIKTEIDFKTIVKNLPGHVYWIDKNNNFLGCNDLQAKALNLSSMDELVGRHYSEFQTKENADLLISSNRRVFEKGLPIVAEEIFERTDGVNIVYLSQKVPLKNEAGEVIGLLGVSIDISSLKETELFLLSSYKKSEKMMRNIIHALPGHVYWKDVNGVILGCNEQQAKTCGFASANEMIGKLESDILVKEEADRVREVDLMIINTGISQIVEELSVSHSGERSTYLSQKVPLKNNKGEVIGILGISFDITDMQSNDVLLLSTYHQSQKILKNFIANLPGHIYWKNRDSVYLGCNDRQAISSGFTKSEELIGKSELELLSKQQAEEVIATDKSVMALGKEQTLEETVTLQGETKTFLSKKEPFFDESGNVVGLLGASFDITEQKQREEQLRQAERDEQKKKIELLQAFGANIAHELRTPLLSIYNYGTCQSQLKILTDAYKLAKDAGLPVDFMQKKQLDYLSKAFDTITNESIKVNSFIDILLSNIKGLNSGDGDKDVKDKFAVHTINDIISNAIARYSFTSDEDRNNIDWQGGEDFTFHGGVVLVEHIFFNLLSNATHFIKVSRKGNISIWTQSDASGHHVYVKDTASGIEPKVLPHIFDHFFSRREHGTGTGLAFCRWAIEMMGGTIDCESVLGEYTTFKLTFPQVISDV